MFWAPFRLNFLCLIVFLVASFRLAVVAQSRVQDDKSTNSGQAASATGQEQDPLKRPLSKKQQKAGRDAISGKEHSLRKWPDEDVSVIITKEERDAFILLSNEEERERYTEIFWQNRDPTPDTIENEYRDEYYRRVAYANERFSSGVPGSKTDRGRIYILHGPPDEIESHPSGGTYERPLQQGGGTTTTFPFETWRYRYLEGVGDDVVLEFVDSCMCGDYHMTIDPTEKDALAHTPMGRPPFPRQNDGSGQLDALRIFVGAQRPPQVRFKDLQEIVSHKVNFNLISFDVLANFVRATSDTVLVPITVQIKNRDITFVNTNGVERGTVNIFGRLTTLTGRVAQTFEDTVHVDIPHDLLAKSAERAAVYGKALPLQPRRYLLELVVKDVNGGRLGTWRHELHVPDFNDDRLVSSSLIVADRMEAVPTTNVGQGNFVIGDTYVRPRVPGADGKPVTFRHGQKIGFWMQIYNLGVDEKTHHPSATVGYDVVNRASGKSVIHSQQSTSQMRHAGDQITLQKTLAASDLQAGIYELRVKINDEVSKQTIEPSAAFGVE